jgi:hypothetical protein
MIEMGGVYSTYGNRRGAYRVWVGKREERDHLEDPGEDGMIILRWISRKWDGGMGRLIWFRIGRGG